MTALTLLQQLHALGVTLTPYSDGTLRYKAPKGVLTDAVRLAIREHKAALLDLVEDFEERAVIMQYEGGLSKEEAESQAFLCVQGEASAVLPCRQRRELHARGDRQMLSILQGGETQA